LGPEKSGRLTGCLIKLKFRLDVDDSKWPLFTGGRCSQVAVKSGLTVQIKILELENKINTVSCGLCVLIHFYKQFYNLKNGTTIVKKNSNTILLFTCKTEQL
jgi:hypothetical protein